MSTKTISLDALSTLFHGGELVFFAGSGISLASQVPGAPEILRRTAKCILPDDLESDLLEKILEIQPEVFYESLLSVSESASDALTLWSALSKRTQDSFGAVSPPTFVHSAISSNAARFGNPIFTTNFDTLFEEAALDLGISPVQTYLPSVTEGVREDPGLKLIKLHGSVSDEGSMLLTMSKITRRNTFWLEYLEEVTRGKAICIVGYSGRDLDIFPAISALAKSTSEPRRVVWIDEFRDSYTNKNSIECGAERVEGMYPDRALLSIGAVGRSPSGCPSGARDLMLDTLEADLNAKLAFGIDQRCLMAGLLLQKVGLHGQSERLLEDLFARLPGDLTERQTAELMLATGALRHERARFLDGVAAWKASATYSNNIRSVLGPSFSTSMKARALRGLAEAYQMQVPARAYFEALYPRDFQSKLAIHGNTLMVMLRVGFLALLRFRELNSEGKIAVVELWFLVVAKLQESFMPVLEKVSSGLTSSFRKFLIRRYEKISLYFYYSEGYAAGVANVQKFLVRLHHDSEYSHAQQLIIQGMITDRTGLILAKRNEADEYISSGNLHVAKSILEEMKALSVEAGVSLSQLKAILGLVFVRLGGKASTSPIRLTFDEYKEIEELKDVIQSPLWSIFLQNLLENSRK